MSDEDVDEVEQREADALAYALERGAAQDGLPEDALQTAALLRYSADGGELPADREEVVLQEVLEAAQRAAEKRVEAAPEPGLAWWKWLLSIATAGAAVAVLLFLLWPREAGPPTELPAPPAGLIAAGLERLEPGADDAAFRDRMGDYRREVYGALSARYE